MPDLLGEYWRILAALWTGACVLAGVGAALAPGPEPPRSFAALPPEQSTATPQGRRAAAALPRDAEASLRRRAASAFLLVQGLALPPLPHVAALWYELVEPGGGGRWVTPDNGPRFLTGIPLHVLFPAALVLGLLPLHLRAVAPRLGAPHLARLALVLAVFPAPLALLLSNRVTNATSGVVVLLVLLLVFVGLPAWAVATAAAGAGTAAIAVRQRRWVLALPDGARISERTGSRRGRLRCTCRTPRTG